MPRMRMQKRLFLFLIILFEGYVVLATELLAIRQLIPFVGSGTEMVAVVISAILMPLAAGYHTGGKRYKETFKRYKKSAARMPSLRRMLIRNLLTALCILTVGLSYVVMMFFFGMLVFFNIMNPIIQASVYSLLFLVVPTFLLAQTVPLISNYFSRDTLSEITGKMLFFSTIGSFLGAILSTIALMTTIGVHHTVILTLGILVILVLLLTRRWHAFDNVIAVFIFCIAIALNGHSMIYGILGIVSNNQYSTISVKPLAENKGKLLMVNNSLSSLYAPNEKDRFKYIQFLEKYFIESISAAWNPKDILVIGGGGFTLGLDDRRNHYTFVDIDAALQDVSEKYFLPEALPANKKFIATSARAFVKRETSAYDLIVIDVYTNIISIPMETTTREFLMETKRLLKPEGILIANIISKPDFSDAFTVRYYNTFASVFRVFDRHVLDEFNPWEKTQERNTMYIFYNRKSMEDTTVYTDDKNTYSLDR